MYAQVAAWPAVVRARVEAEMRRGARLAEIRTHKASNSLQEIVWSDRSVWVVKRATQYVETSLARFETDRAAAALLRVAGVLAPEHLCVCEESGSAWMLYPRIEQPTLRAVWSECGETRQNELLRSWGRLIARIHAVRDVVPGPLVPEGGRRGDITAFLEEDLERRMLPQMQDWWQEAAPLCLRLLGALPTLRLNERPQVLNHNDLHMDNILCSRSDGACVGVLDLEAAIVAPPELDFGRMQVYHGPRLGTHLARGWFAQVLDGYGDDVKEDALAFFRAYHGVNVGSHFRRTGHGTLAASLLADAERDWPPSITRAA